MQPCLTKRNSNPFTNTRGIVAKLIYIRGTAWPKGTTLKVGFLNGDQSFHSQMMQGFNDWARIANIKFTQVANPLEGDIRVVYNPSGGNWSKLGTQARQTNAEQPTMNIADVEIGTIRHEIGHALGFDHEHKSPFGGIKWNKSAVINELSGPPNSWTEQEINFNLFDQYAEDQVNGSEYDPRSIMHYPIKASWTTNGYSVGYNTEFSEKDKEWAARIYPFDSATGGDTAGSENGGGTTTGEGSMETKSWSIRDILPEESLWIVAVMLLLIYWSFNKKKKGKRVKT